MDVESFTVLLRTWTQSTLNLAKICDSTLNYRKGSLIAMFCLLTFENKIPVKSYHLYAVSMTDDGPHGK